MTLGYWAPMPPARTGVAQYAESLARALEKHIELRINAPGDAALYHIGNNGLHREIHARALESPGVVVLHDAVLHHFLLGALTREQYIAEFVFNYGEWTRSLAEELWAGRARSAADPRYFRYPMLRRLAEASTCIIVHNSGAAAMVRSHCPAARVAVMPHLYEPVALPTAADVAGFRREHGIPADAVLFGIFGHLRESKRIWSALRALDATPRAALILAGEFASADLAKALKPEIEARPNVYYTGALSEWDFLRCACAVEACINLKYPPAGETSGVAIRLMGAAKPVLLTESEETASYPGDVCIRVDAGEAEVEMLAHYMAWLAAEPVTAREIGARAQRYVLERHSPGQAAEIVLGIICGS